MIIVCNVSGGDDVGSCRQELHIEQCITVGTTQYCDQDDYTYDKLHLSQKWTMLNQR